MNRSRTRYLSACDAWRGPGGLGVRGANEMREEKWKREGVGTNKTLTSRSEGGCEVLAGGCALSRRLNPCRPAEAERDGTNRSEYTVSRFIPPLAPPAAPGLFPPPLLPPSPDIVTDEWDVPGHTEGGGETTRTADISPDSGSTRFVKEAAAN